jgi:hypothetical protein
MTNRTDLSAPATQITIRPGPVICIWSQEGQLVTSVPVSLHMALALTSDLLRESRCALKGGAR